MRSKQIGAETIKIKHKLSKEILCGFFDKVYQGKEKILEHRKKKMGTMKVKSRSSYGIRHMRNGFLTT